MTVTKELLPWDRKGYFFFPEVVFYNLFFQHFVKKAQTEVDKRRLKSRSFRGLKLLNCNSSHISSLPFPNKRV